MTRVTAPIAKLARSLAANPTVARPAYLVSAGAAVWSDHADRDDNGRHFTMDHRPIPMPLPSRNRIVPLMQTFHYQTSAPKAARLDTSAIDFAFLPSLDEPAPSAARAIRVPLLPDNFFPDRSQLEGHAPEVADAPLATPEISIVAAHPELVTPASPLTEIESIGVDGVELQFAHLPETQGGVAASQADREPGMLRDLWKGLVADVMGSAPKTA